MQTDLIDVNWREKWKDKEITAEEEDEFISELEEETDQDE